MPHHTCMLYILPKLQLRALTCKQYHVMIILRSSLVPYLVCLEV